MVQVDVPAAFMMGQVYAMLAKESLKKEPSLKSNYFLLLSNLYMALILVPTGLFLLVGWPGWETMYQWAWVGNTQAQPFTALFYVSFLIALVILGHVGFTMTHKMMRNGKEGLAKVIMVISIIGTVAPFLIDINAPFYVGTYEQYHSGNAVFILKSPFFWSWFCIMLYWVAGSVLVGMKIKSESKCRVSSAD